MHMWAHGATVLPSHNNVCGPNTALFLCLHNYAALRQYAGPCSKWPQGHPMAAVKENLSIMGYNIITSPTCPKGIPAVVVCWNAPLHANEVDMLRERGARVMVLEHGFWKRNTYSQCDPVGTQHWSSWAPLLRNPAPPEGAARLQVFYPNGIVPIRAKDDGYVLVIGQVPNDTQLSDSEIQDPRALQEAVKAALPAETPVFFRPHPASRAGTDNILPVMAQGGRGAAHYRKFKVGSGLNEALAGARFVITINSTAGNEALAAGVPVLAFGPALYTEAGVAKQTSLATLSQDIWIMLNGWCPAQDEVQNYLEWLAARQWTRDELAKPETLKMIMGEDMLSNVPRTCVCGAPLSSCKKALVVNKPEWFIKQRPMIDGVAEGLKRHGYCVEHVELQTSGASTLKQVGGTPDVVVVWNGLRPSFKAVVDEAKARGSKLLIMENGFLDRSRYCQLDHQGILHHASWRNTVLDEPGADAYRRLEDLLPAELLEIRNNRSKAVPAGKIAHIGQVLGDSQMYGCEVRRNAVLAQLIVRTGYAGDVVYRAHPKSRKKRVRGIIPCQSPTLAGCLEDAPFAVMINSNTAHECMVADVPVLAFGPCLYSLPGLCRQTTTKSFDDDWAAMLDGWRPDTDLVWRYMANLITHQYSADELVEGSAILKCLEDQL
jgi:hypothetical protein